MNSRTGAKQTRRLPSGCTEALLLASPIRGITAQPTLSHFSLTLALQLCKNKGMDRPAPSYSLHDLIAEAEHQLGETISARTVRLYATEGLIDRPGKNGRCAVYGKRQLLQLLLIRSLAQRGLSLTAIAPLVAEANQQLEEQLEQLLTPREIEVNCIEALTYLHSLPTQMPPQRQSRRTQPTRGSKRERWQRIPLAEGVELHLSNTASLPPSGPDRERWLIDLLQALREQLDANSP
jgi:DNA-binding transcriptional MerR regulator